MAQSFFFHLNLTWASWFWPRSVFCQGVGRHNVIAAYLGHKIEKVGQDHVGLVFGHAVDSLGEASVDVYALPAGHRVGADHGVLSNKVSSLVQRGASNALTQWVAQAFRLIVEKAGVVSGSEPLAMGPKVSVRSNWKTASRAKVLFRGPVYYTAWVQWMECSCQGSRRGFYLQELLHGGRQTIVNLVTQRPQLVTQTPSQPSVTLVCPWWLWGGTILTVSPPVLGNVWIFSMA